MRSSSIALAAVAAAVVSAQKTCTFTSQIAIYPNGEYPTAISIWTGQGATYRQKNCELGSAGVPQEGTKIECDASSIWADEQTNFQVTGLPYSYFDQNETDIVSSMSPNMGDLD